MHGDADMERLGQLVVYLRRHGVPVHEAAIIDDDVLALSFDNNLGQASHLEYLLLGCPGIVRVTCVAPGLVRAHRTASPVAGRRASSRPPRWWRRG
ncbi:hypothetical protein Kisp02_29210 [Kineosporia sp. NBRC 101731]|nr:hypothetical protein Kisp02_29210 [Kineosporia sp. NBRC 101731]